MSFATSVSAISPESYRGPLLIIVAPEGGMPASLQSLDRALGGAVGRVFAAGDFKGKRDEQALCYPATQIARVLLVGIGKPAEVGRKALRRGAAVGAKRARALGIESAAIFCPLESRGTISARDRYQVLAEGAAQGAWKFLELKKPPEEPKPPLTAVELLADADQLAEATEGARIGGAIGAGTLVARGIQVLPPNTCTPTYLGEFARQLAERHGHGVTVLDRAAIIAEKMGALMAVAQGSVEEPRFIALEYRGTSGTGANGAPVVLVGKGVTFDTGGISIKPAQSMEDMKYDMSGAAAVLGTFEMLGRLKPRIDAIGLIPAVENMPSGTAYRPADVVTSHLGKTIEVINTDAEGRLILADALSYARRYRPACVLDIATLTGAIGIALGPVAAGVMGEPAALVQEVIGAGQRADERVWELPLWDEYRELIKSDIADVKNSGGRAAGSITAAWFLKEFVEGFPWAHLDVAATAYTDRDDPASVKGPTAMGVRLFSEFLLARAGT
jgi:leucyl aminopeptidase